MNDSNEALAHPLAANIGVKNLSMKKSSIGGNQYLDYLWEWGCSWTKFRWCWRCMGAYGSQVVRVCQLVCPSSVPGDLHKDNENRRWALAMI